jgi:REP element-mobilizing transposase RayT
MPAWFKHDQQNHSIYFVTFTCFKWKWLFELSDAWHSVYKWFDALYKKDVRVTGYVIMPNHIHVLHYFAKMQNSLNSVIGNAKRFMAYDIIKGLEEKKQLLCLKSCIVL